MPKEPKFDIDELIADANAAKPLPSVARPAKLPPRPVEPKPKKAPEADRHSALRTVARVYQFSAWLAFIASVITAIAKADSGGDGFTVFTIIAGGFGAAFSLSAFAAFLYLMLDIEANTWATRQALERRGESGVAE